METNEPLMDVHGRKFTYLRLSITDVCNYKCSYCLPNGYKKEGSQEFLSCDEIGRLVTAFSELGLSKVRLTGGEPTVREDYLDIAKRISSLANIRKLAMTTNGYKLPERAKEIYDAGICSVNISIDSLNPENFREITGQNRLQEALDGMEECLSLGFDSVKINTVLLNRLNSSEIPDFLEFVKHRSVSLRFIELMRTKDNQDYFMQHHLSGNVLTRALGEQGWKAVARKTGDGPAVEFYHPDYQGRIGLIAPYSKDFCSTCNRLRISSTGQLHLCLFGEGGVSIRQYLESDSQKEELKSYVSGLMGMKGKGHSLLQGYSGQTRHLASIGG